MPVFVHTIDVTLLCLDKFPEWREKIPELCLESVTLGALLHDLSKASAREGGKVSHSYIMSTSPEKAVREALDVLEEAQFMTGTHLSPERIDHIWHIIAAHHGRWGKVSPRTPEAALVHEMDYYSATHNRCSPVDSNDILPLLKEGQKWAAIGSRLGVSTSVLRDRLKEACRAERVHNWVDLMAIWEQRGYVVSGSLERMERVDRVRRLMQTASQAPRPIIDAIARI